MKSPESNAISIRLEINVPTGLCPAVAVEPPAGRLPGVTLRSYETVVPDAGAHHAVLPDGSGLGTICAQITYASQQANVWMAAFPLALYPADPEPTDAFPRANWARRGTTTNNLTWSWAGANAVAGAAHLPEPGAPNMLGIWHQALSSATTTYEDAHLFMGVTNMTPCASGSGRDGVGKLAPPDACLLVRIPDGPHAGTHLANPSGKQTWKAVIGGVPHLILSSGHGLLVRAGAAFAASKTAGGSPFAATFPGSFFCASCDVVVRVA